MMLLTVDDYLKTFSVEITLCQTLLHTKQELHNNDVSSLSLVRREEELCKHL